MNGNDQQLLEGRLAQEATRQEIEAEEPEPQELAFQEAQEEAAFQEADYANQLASEQEQEVNAINILHEEGKSFGSRPSFIKYFVLFFMLAVPNDAIDALELTGLLEILAWFVSFFLSISSILIFWFFDHEQKRAQAYLKKTEEFQKTLAHTARTVLRVAKLFRHTKVARNPIFKIIIGAVAELIPFLSIFPWSSISVFLAYLDERKAYKNAKETGEEIGKIAIERPEMV